MPEKPARETPVLIVGGGWAGLAAAVELSRHRQPVLLLEASRQLGGRARSLRVGDSIVDNGQHLMIGAYQSMLTLMQMVGIAPERAFERLPLTLHLYKGAATSLRVRAPKLPAPLHLLVALLTARGLSARERISAIRFGRRLLKLSLRPEEDFSVQALLHSEAQSSGLISKLWAPLCIATLNTPIDIASARLFITVFQKAFGEINKHSDLLVPRLELSDLLPRPSAEFIEAHGGRIELGQRVTALDVDSGRLCGVSIGERKIAADQVILATPHIIARRLLNQHVPTRELAHDLAELGNEPVSTLYLQYPEHTRLPLPVVGLESGTGQWVFDRRICGQAGMMAVVISARGEHRDMPPQVLADRVSTELATAFPDWPPPRYVVQLIREKRATFCARAGIDSRRPQNLTPIEGLWLAGDYTATGIPATLESAVVSGIRCANGILRGSQH